MASKSLKWERDKYSQRKKSYCNTALVHIKNMESARNPTTAGWVKNKWNVYTVEFYSTIKKIEI